MGVTSNKSGNNNFNITKNDKRKWTCCMWTHYFSVNLSIPSSVSALLQTSLSALTHLKNRLALCSMHPYVGCSLCWDGEAFPPPQHGGGRVGHHVAADVHRVPLPRVIDGVVGQELWYICPTCTTIITHALTEVAKFLVCLELVVPNKCLK